MKMVNMAEPGVKSTKDKEFPPNHDTPEGPTVHLNHEHMKALGMHKNMPTVGQKIPMEGHMHVTSVSNHEGRMSMTAELRKMAVDATKKAASQDVEEGKLKGAKAAMDQALDKQE
jgi:hypothetical protein